MTFSEAMAPPSASHPFKEGLERAPPTAVSLPPNLPAIPPPPVPPPQDDPLLATLKSLSHESLLHRALASERLLRQWRSAASHFFSALALAPTMTEAYYARTLRNLLSHALERLDSIDELRHIESSMPCVSTERPDIYLHRWDGLSYSEWHLQWSPSSWWVSVSANGSRWGIAFNCLTTVTDISLRGLVRCAFTPDMSAVRVAFLSRPHLHMQVASSVGWGAVPLPVQQSIEQLVRAEIGAFVQSTLTGEDNVVIALKKSGVQSLSETDVLEAKAQAQRACNVNLRPSTLL